MSAASDVGRTGQHDAQERARPPLTHGVGDMQNLSPMLFIAFEIEMKR